LELELSEDEVADALTRAYDQIGYLTDQLAQTRAELDSLENKRTVEEVKASMIQPFADKVFCFVVVYCLAVGAFLIGDGFSNNGFDLDESTIGIIAGSTAVSVIGLIGMVVSGLFGKSGK
jgi:hypothetical protein